MANFPRPYTQTVPAEGKEKYMEYVPFDRLGIGARSSGLPKTPVSGVGSLDHVGKSASK